MDFSTPSVFDQQKGKNAALTHPLVLCIFRPTVGICSCTGRESNMCVCVGVWVWVCGCDVGRGFHIGNKPVLNVHFSFYKHLEGKNKLMVY